MTERLYLVPDYYPRFQCKGGDCRACCCVGWGVSISMREYFTLLGLDCGPELRRRLDCAFHIVEQPSPERYAQLNHRFDGDCPLRREDGLCRLHAECGEGALPAICRYYPRGAHTARAAECSCANSCEATLELLIAQREPIRFERMPLAFNLPELHAQADELTTQCYEPARSACLGALQRRAHALPARLTRLSRSVAALGEGLVRHDPASVGAALRALADRDMGPPHVRPNPALSLRVQQRLAHLCMQRESGVSGRCRAAQAVLGLGEGPDIEVGQLSVAASRYRAASARFAASHPNWELWFEQLLVNHAFYAGYPFENHRGNLWEAHVALCAVYALMRLLAVGTLHDTPGEAPFVDLMASAFRLIEHSGFDWNATLLLRSMGCDNMRRLDGVLMGCG
ncbi:MAG: flagellin lysine-N-methylase [Christensenellaceae bacterium]|nr:flagellin lysine-N-methylase [Christensenellaceae bacterium]MEA5069181.1 flagellin lysine-N-methylase [Christensenellaceae bacterium]